MAVYYGIEMERRDRTTWMRSEKLPHHRYNVCIKAVGGGLKMIYLSADYERVRRVREKIIEIFKQEGYSEFTMPKGQTLFQIKNKKKYLKLKRMIQ